MEIKEAMLAVLKEYIFPELQEIKHNQAQMETGLAAVNRRLDDHNTHLVDQSRRIDVLRTDLTQKIDALDTKLTQRIDGVEAKLTQNSQELRTELIQKIDGVETKLTQRMAAVETKLTQDNKDLRTELTQNITEVRGELNGRMDKHTERLDKMTARLDKITERMDRIHDDLIMRNDEANRAIAQLYNVVVRKEDYQLVLGRVQRLERELEEIKRRVAA